MLIKLLATITLVLAPLFIKSGSVTRTGTPTAAPGTTIEQHTPGFASVDALRMRTRSSRRSVAQIDLAQQKGLPIGSPFCACSR